jgi:hypothetical protein
MEYSELYWKYFQPKVKKKELSKLENKLEEGEQERNGKQLEQRTKLKYLYIFDIG